MILSTMFVAMWKMKCIQVSIFLQAYKKVKKKIGPRRIKEIQEETLYMVDTKYRNMKNTMKISGIAGTILYGFAVLFKIQHWAGAGILMTLGALILALVFMPSALTVLWKETQNKKRIFLFISAFFSALFFISGTLFKLQHWPGAAICLSLAALSGVLFFIPALMISRMTEPENKSKRPAYISRCNRHYILCIRNVLQDTTLASCNNSPGSGDGPLVFDSTSCVYICNMER